MRVASRWPPSSFPTRPISNFESHTKPENIKKIVKHCKQLQSLRDCLARVASRGTARSRGEDSSAPVSHVHAFQCEHAADHQIAVFQNGRDTAEGIPRTAVIRKHPPILDGARGPRSEEHTSELQ